jgi:hypothetical protein
MSVEQTPNQSTPRPLEEGSYPHSETIPRRHVMRRVSAHGSLSWITLILAILFYILTILYAWRSDLISRDELFGGSPAKALRVLNVLSWLGNSLLGLAISQALDLTRAMLTARQYGHCLLDNLALQSGTGIDGLFEIIWKSRSLRKFKPGAWSIFRLVSMTIVPILGSVVLSTSAFQFSLLFPLESSLYAACPRY